MERRKMWQSGLDKDCPLWIRNPFIHPLYHPVVGKYTSPNTGVSVCKMELSGVEIMGIVLMVVGLIGLALLAYLFYVLFRGEEL